MLTQEGRVLLNAHASICSRQPPRAGILVRPEPVAARKTPLGRGTSEPWAAGWATPLTGRHLVNPVAVLMYALDGPERILLGSSAMAWPLPFSPLHQ